MKIEELKQIKDKKMNMTDVKKLNTVVEEKKLSFKMNSKKNEEDLSNFKLDTDFENKDNIIQNELDHYKIQLEKKYFKKEELDNYYDLLDKQQKLIEEEKKLKELDEILNIQKEFLINEYKPNSIYELKSSSSLNENYIVLEMKKGGFQNWLPFIKKLEVSSIKKELKNEDIKDDNLFKKQVVFLK